MGREGIRSVLSTPRSDSLCKRCALKVTSTLSLNPLTCRGLATSAQEKQLLEQKLLEVPQLQTRLEELKREQKERDSRKEKM